MGGSGAMRLRVKGLRFFVVARAADRDEADRFFMAIFALFAADFAASNSNRI